MQQEDGGAVAGNDAIDGNIAAFDPLSIEASEHLAHPFSIAKLID